MTHEHDVGSLKQRVARLERLTQFLLDQLKLEFTDNNPEGFITPEIAELVRKGNTLEAIKLYREHTGAGLKEAKDAIDRMAAR